MTNDFKVYPPPKILRAPILELRIYEISEAELENVERGSLESIYLNLAIFFLSSAISIGTSLAFAEVKNTRLFIVFALVVIVFAVAGLILGILWWPHRNAVQRVTSAVRSRMPSRGEQIPLFDELPSPGASPPTSHP
jgi:hypothetical protein